MALPPESPSMVGREAELTELRSALSSAAAGNPVAVVLGGEAGVGKTRLVNEFTAEAARAGTRIVVGQCVDVGTDGLAYAPIAGALRDMAAQIGTGKLVELAGPGRTALAGLLPELGIVPGDAVDGQGRLFEVVTVLLEHIAETEPLVLVIEDLHWADGSTRHLLRFAVRALGNAHVLLLGTYRSDELTRSHPLRALLAELDRVRTVQRIDVPRLTERQVGEQLAGIHGKAHSLETIRQVYRRSEGVPFFVEQLAGLGAGDAALPDSLRDLLLIRVERLSDSCQGLVRLLAVGRQHVDHDLLAAVADIDVDALDHALREAVSANILRVDGDGYGFQHALVREAVHDDLLPGEHARLHSRYAATLERHAQLGAARSATAEIAMHWYCAHELEKSFAASLLAADEALGTVAFDEAQHAFERALELWDQVPEPAEKARADHVELLARAASAATDAGEIERALTLVDAALAETDVDATPLRVAELLASRAKLLSELGRPESMAVIHRALELVPADPPSPLRARLRQMLGSRLMMEGRCREAVDVSLDAAALAEATGAVEVQFRAYVVLGPSLVNIGRADEGLAALQTARELAGDRPGRLVTYHINTSDALHLLGRFEASAALAREGIDRAREAGLARSLGAMIAGNAAEPLLVLGR